MKNSIWHLSLMLLAGFGLVSALNTRAYGQLPTVTHDPAGQPSSTSTDGGATVTGSCSQPPCLSLNTGRKSTATPPGPRKFTEAELEEMRYGRLFGEIAGLEQAAQREDNAGHNEVAASYRGYLAAKSGLTQEEVEIVKKIGTKYGQDSWAWQSKYRETILAVRHANPDRMSRLNSPEIAAVKHEKEILFTNMKVELIQALGSKSFTRLDSYMRHSHDNAKSLSPEQTPSTTGQQSLIPETNGAK